MVSVDEGRRPQNPRLDPERRRFGGQQPLRLGLAPGIGAELAGVAGRQRGTLVLTFPGSPGWAQHREAAHVHQTGNSSRLHRSQHVARGLNRVPLVTLVTAILCGGRMHDDGRAGERFRRYRAAQVESAPLGDVRVVGIGGAIDAAHAKPAEGERPADLPAEESPRSGQNGEWRRGGGRPRRRALYRGPRILLLDEATSHLDEENERAINEAIRQLPVTRVIVAHRRSTLDMADRIVPIWPGLAASKRTG